MHRLLTVASQVLKVSVGLLHSMASFSPLANGIEATVTGALVAALATTRKAKRHDDEEDEVDTAGDAMRPSSLGDVIARSVLL